MQSKGSAEKRKCQAYIVNAWEKKEAEFEDEFQKEHLLGLRKRKGTSCPWMAQGGKEYGNEAQDSQKKISSQK